MSELIQGKALSELSIDGKTVKPGQEFEANKKTMDHLIRIGVVEDPAVARAAREAEKASNAEADEKAQSIVAEAQEQAKEIFEKAEAEADEKAKTVTAEAIAEADKLVEDAKVEATKIVKDAEEAAKKVPTVKPATASK